MIFNDFQNTGPTESPHWFCSDRLPAELSLIQGETKLIPNVFRELPKVVKARTYPNRRLRCDTALYQI